MLAVFVGVEIEPCISGRQRKARKYPRFSVPVSVPLVGFVGFFAGSTASTSALYSPLVPKNTGSFRGQATSWEGALWYSDIAPWAVAGLLCCISDARHPRDIQQHPSDASHQRSRPLALACMTSPVPVRPDA